MCTISYHEGYILKPLLNLLCGANYKKLVCKIHTNRRYSIYWDHYPLKYIMLGQVDKQNVSKCDTAEKATFHKNIGMLVKTR